MKYFFLLLRCAAFFISFTFMSRVQAQCTFTALYVDSSKTSNSSANGSSWALAYPTLYQALNAASNCPNVNTIYVAKGTYKASSSPSRSTAFNFKRLGLKLYGGYSSGGAIRNTASYPTVLSGERGNTGNTADNQWHVVVIAGLSGTTDSLVMDGFTITGGHADYEGDNDPFEVTYNNINVKNYNGGGMVITENAGVGKRIAIRNCTLTGNYSVNSGGGVYVSNSSPQFRNCFFSNCSGDFAGGGIYGTNFDGELNTCTFTGNSSVLGSGICNSYESSPAIISCTVNNNNANGTGSAGAGIYNSTKSSPAISNCDINNNTSSQVGGGIYNRDSSSPAISNCTIYANSSNMGAGIYNISNSSPAINNCDINNNTSTQTGGGMYNTISSSPTIRKCRFISNSSSTRGGGAIYNLSSSSPVIISSIFSANSCLMNGAGISNNSSSSPSITNCVFVSNASGQNGGAIYNDNSSPVVTNSTFFRNTCSDNSSAYNGSFMYNGNASNPIVSNCIIRSNTNNGVLTSSLYNLNSTTKATYNIIQDGFSSGGSGVGNVNLQPLFVNNNDPEGPDNIWGTTDDGLALQTCSPAINTGNNDSIPSGITTDITGSARKQSRVQGGAAIVDKGAYESAPLTSTAAQLAGTIGNPHTIPYPQELLNDSIRSVAAPSTSATIRWEKSENNGATWVTATPAGNQAFYKIPELSKTTLYRRAALVCDSPYYSNTVEIKVIISDGTLGGQVKSLSSGLGVDGIPIEVTRKTSISGSYVGYTYRDTTKSGGFYTVRKIYWGEAGNTAITSSFYVKPVKAGHNFTPSLDSATLDYSNYNQINNKNFNDNSTITISGTVSQRCDGCLVGTQPVSVTCPIDSVKIFNSNNGNNIYLTQTGLLDGIYGRYAISVVDQSPIKLKPDFYNHVFTPSDTTVIPVNNIPNVNFTDTTTHVISGKFSAGCGVSIGTATLEFTDVLPNGPNATPRTCFRKQVTTNSAGVYSIRLPARKYQVKLIGLSSQPTGIIADTVKRFINELVAKDSLTRDITGRDTTLNIVYVRPPVISLAGLNTVCTTPAPFALIRQNDSSIFNVFVYQGPANIGCPLSDTSKLKIVTNVQQEDQMEVLQYAIADTGSRVKLKGGIPKIVGDHLKDIYVYFTDKYGRTAEAFNRKVLVTGVKADEATFTTVSPEVPLVVLHDPPGDASYSTWQQSKSITNAVRFYTASALGGEAWLEAKIGAATTVGVGVLTDISAWGIIRGTIGINSTTTSSNEAILTTTTTQNFSTSGNPDVTGQGGDVYIGAALNLIYATATDIGFTDCGNITSDRRLIVANNGFATQYIYSEDYIVNTLIPNLQSLAQLSPDSAARYLNQVKVWQQVVANNAENKRRAAFVENKSFDGSAGPYTNTTTTSSSKTSTIEFNTEFNASIAAELGFEVGGNGVSGGVTVNFKMETGESESNTTTDETTISYTLDDNTPGDFFSVNVKKDPVYNTPVFELAAGTASCPVEPGAQPRDDMYFVAANPVLQNVPGSDYANFTLKIYNTSQSHETRTYRLAYDQGTNIANESVRIAGTDYTGTPVTLAPLAYLDSATVIVSIKRLAGSNVYSYEGERFRVMDNCDGSVSKSVLVSAYYVSPCSNISFTQPTDGWLINSNSANSIFIQPAGYNPATLTSVNLQYSTGTSWTDGPFLTPAQLASGYNWNVSGLPDGTYSIRLRLDCSGGVVYSQRATGIIDRKAPALYGVPSPTDDNYVTGDVIAFTYTETLNINPDSVQVTVRRLSNGQLIPATVSISDNRLVVTPTTSIAGFTGDSIRVIVNRITDQYGNRKLTADTTRFTIGTTVVGTGNQALTLSITNPTVYKNGDSTINVFFNLPVNTTDPVRVNYTISGTARYGIDYTATWSGSDALYSSFNGSTGAIKIGGNSRQAVLRIKPIGGDTSLSPDKTVIISLAEGGDYSIGATPFVTGKISSEDGIITYVFIGDGNWNIKNNWQNGNMPLTTLVAPKEIIVNPSGIARLNVQQTIKPGAKITVKQNRQMVIQGNLKQQ